MKELSKSTLRRLHNPNFITRYFVGNGIDIGGLPDPLSLYLEFFPLMKSVKIWDLPDGDAQYMQSVLDESFDFIVSSHCLEHLVDPVEGIMNWFRILKPGGHLVITIPEEDLYEQRAWPSNKNHDHKWTFTIWKESSWSPKSINVLDLVKELGPCVDVRSIHVEDKAYRFELPEYDQTLTPVAESAIELVLRKKTKGELLAGTSKSSTGVPIRPELLPYFNQYIDDMSALKESNGRNKPPFTNTEDITWGS
jgi:SAM-dependent methyltransferase